MCSLILNLGINWPHRGQASLDGCGLLKNEVMGAVLEETPVLTSPFFLLLDNDKLRLSLSLLGLSVMVENNAFRSFSLLHPPSGNINTSVVRLLMLRHRSANQKTANLAQKETL